MKIDLNNIKKTKIKLTGDFYQIMRKIFYDRSHEMDVDREHFWTIALSSSLTVLCIELVAIGSRKEVIVEPVDVYKLPLYKAADKLVLIHNHPSNNLTPSEEDIDVTNRLMKAGDVLGIELIDSIIIGDGDYFSFKEARLIEDLENSIKYGLSFVYKKKMETKMKNLGKKNLKIGREIGREEILKELLKDGLITQEQANKMLEKQYISH